MKTALQNQGASGPCWCKFLQVSVALLVLASVPVAATPTKNPKRGLKNYTVDLTPLFKWWAKHDGARPLISWVHLTGTIVGTNAGAWVIEAQVEPGGSRAGEAKEQSAKAALHESLKILLLNPPLEDLAEFEHLTVQLNDLNRQRGVLAGEETQAKTQDQAVTEQQHGHPNRIRSRILALEDRQLKQTESQAKAVEKALDSQIQEVKKKLSAYPSTDHYEVDCFALDLQYDSGQMPVYDHGRVVN